MKMEMMQTIFGELRCIFGDKIDILWDIYRDGAPAVKEEIKNMLFTFLKESLIDENDPYRSIMKIKSMFKSIGR